MVDDDLEESTAIFSVRLSTPARATSEPVYILVQTSGSDIGKPIPLNGKSRVLIGRRSECDLVLKYEGVSRRHAQLVFQNGDYVLEDLRSANGTRVQGKRVSRVRLEDGDTLQFGPLASFRYSITDEAEARMLQSLYEASVHDSLTGAFNRDYLFERLESEISFAVRHRTETALILFDLDHFKYVNDTFGHQAGDRVLVEVCNTVRQDLRMEDILARYGGEEFAISVRGADIEGVRRLAERIRVRNCRVIRVDGHDIPVSASIGCAALSDCDRHPTPKQLIGIADRRLYIAKANGRNRVVAAG